MMAGLDDLSRGGLGRMKRDIRQLGTAAPLQNASIGANGIRVYDGGVITIENGGGLKITGSAEVIGELIASGTISFTGEFTQSGQSTFTGPTHLDGDTDVTGTLAVEGATTLKGDMTLTTGKIKAGGLTIDPSASGGSLVFSGGGGVQGGPGPTLLKGAGNAGFISDTTATVFAGSNSVDVSPAAVTINGPLKAPGITSTSNAANVYFDPTTKQLYYKP
jgi:hypothetical protein